MCPETACCCLAERSGSTSHGMQCTWRRQGQLLELLQAPPAWPDGWDGRGCMHDTKPCSVWGKSAEGGSPRGSSVRLPEVPHTTATPSTVRGHRHPPQPCTSLSRFTSPAPPASSRSSHPFPGAGAGRAGLLLPGGGSGRQVAAREQEAATARLPIPLACDRRRGSGAGLSDF